MATNNTENIGNTDIDEALTQMKMEVNKVFRLRDEYFVTHTDADAKTRVVEDALSICTKRLDQIEANVDARQLKPYQKARLCYERGRALNVSPCFNAAAEQLLSKAAKLDPQLHQAWNELGELYWKANQSSTAKMCFEQAVTKSDQQDKTSLRNLSIALRATSDGEESKEQRLQRIEQGLSRAKEAVQLDTSDGKSWSILGNAYLAHFFSVAQNPRTIKQAMSAYRNAQRDPVADTTAELHYNKAVAHKYEEEYSSALESFDKAVRYDPSWEEPRDQMKNLAKFIGDVQNTITSKGKLKMKRFNALLEKLKIVHNKDKHQEEDPNKGLVHFSRLCEGSNRAKRILGTVIASVHSNDSVPFTFVMTDAEGECVAVNVYNLSPGKGVIIGDQVGLSEPEVRRVQVNRENKSFDFKLIRVDSPISLLVNGKRASPEMQAGIEMSTFTRKE